MITDLGDAVRQVLPSVRADLERLVRIPSVSADPDADRHGLASAATTAGPPREAGPPARDGRRYGRGTADDKAGVAVHLAALRAHGDRLPVGVTVLVEGEEEVGSPALPGFLDAFSDALRADVVVFADAGNWTEDIPALTTSLRGGTSVVGEGRTLRHGVHSGMYGGPAPDALAALWRLLGSPPRATGAGE